MESLKRNHNKKNTMQDEYKPYGPKIDHQGNELSEEIGKGLNEDHELIIIQEFKRKQLSIMIEETKRDKLIEACKHKGGYSEVLRQHIDQIINSHEFKG